MKLSNLNKRIDGSYHTPLSEAVIKELKKAYVELTNCGDKRVTKEIILPGRFKRHYVDELHGTPFLSGKNISQINPVGVKYLSNMRHDERIEKLMLEKNMILITCSGTIGKVMICPGYYENYCANQHILRLIPSDKINPGYVYCFLASEYGKALIQKFTYGSVVDEIDDNHLAAVPFPLPKENKLIDEIGNLVLEANENRNEAWRLERQAIKEVETLIIGE